jgi:hypothetical protein
MIRPTAALFACMILCWTSTRSQSADVSGAWKIDTQGGPAPLCNLVQVDNALGGTCVGPQASGTVTGTVAGSTVRWRWQWAAYAGSAASAFDFAATLQPDSLLKGLLERRETGLSLNFTAKKQQPQWTEAMQQDWDRRNTPVTPKFLQVPQQPPLTAKGQEIAAADRAFADRPGEETFDRDLVVRANSLFGSFGTQEQMRRRDAWLTAQQQARARNQIETMRAGHDYTLEWRSR